MKQKTLEQSIEAFEFGLFNQIKFLTESLDIAERFNENPYDSPIVDGEVAMIHGYLNAGLYLGILQDDYEALSRELRRWQRGHYVEKEERE